MDPIRRPRKVSLAEDKMGLASKLADFARSLYSRRQHVSTAPQQFPDLPLVAKGILEPNDRSLDVPAFVAVLRAFDDVFSYTMSDDERAKDELERATMVAEAKKISVQQAIEELGIHWTPTLLATITMLLMRKWTTIGSEQIYRIWAHVVSGGIRPREMSSKWEIASVALHALTKVDTWLSSRNSERPSGIFAAADLMPFESLARLLLKSGSPELAVAVLQAAINCAWCGPADDRLVLARKMVAYSSTSESNAFKGMVLRNVIGLSAVLEEHSREVQLRAIDLVYSAVLESARLTLSRDLRRNALAPYMQMGSVKSLIAMCNLEHPDSDRSVLPRELQRARIWPLVTQVPIEEWLASLRGLTQLFVSLENDRLKVEPAPIEIGVSEWASHAFRLPAFMRAVPYANSFPRTKDVGELLLLMRHEFVHVHCMGTGIGSVLAPLRAAVVRIEKEFEVIGDIDRDDDDERKPGVRTFGKKLRKTARNLILAESQIDCLERIHALQTVWTHWFEGVAVFAELHAFSQDASDTWSAWFTPIPFLLDVIVGQDGEIAAKERFAKGGQDLERLADQACADLGYFRLRNYLCNHSDKYMCGYLAVRAVVASWRARLGQRIAGERVARLLVELTQQLPSDAVPDLNVPLDEFEEQCVTQMIEWISSLSSIPIELLNAFSVDDQSGHPLIADDGVDLNPSDEAFADHVLQGLRVASRQTTLLVNHTHHSAEQSTEIEIERGPGYVSARDDVREFWRNSGDVLLDGSLNAWRSHMVMPIGEAESPFWVNSDARLLFVLLRTVETAEATGKPQYLSFMILLPASDVTHLVREISRRRHARMRVLRVVDLAASRSDEHVFGFQYLVLQYGNFVHVRAVGPHASRSDAMNVPQSLLNDIKSRLLDPDIELDHVEIGQHFFAPAGRIAHWADKLEKSESEDDSWKDLDASPQWREDVAHKGYRALDMSHGERAIDVAKPLLGCVIQDDELREALLSGGLRACVDSASDLEQLLRILIDTGRSGSTDRDPQSLGVAGKLFCSTIFGTDCVPPSSWQFGMNQ